jgi:hypothetical protein
MCRVSEQQAGSTSCSQQSRSYFATGAAIGSTTAAGTNSALSATEYTLGPFRRETQVQMGPAGMLPAGQPPEGGQRVGTENEPR